MKNNKTLLALLLTVIALTPSIVRSEPSEQADTSAVPADETQKLDPSIPATVIAYVSISGCIESATETVVELYKVRKDENIKALFLHIDSGGGKFASVEIITDAIKEIKKLKPVVAFIENKGCSGGYLIASAADWIIAQKSSDIGSIGVVYTDGFNNEETVIHLTSGKYKRSYRKSKEGFDPAVLAYEQKQVNDLAQVFFTLIADNRRLSIEKIQAQEARTYTGVQALENGLIDQICTVDQALAKIAELIVARGGTLEENVVMIDSKGKPLMKL